MTEPFHSRYAIRPFDDGGVAIDLSSGDFFRLNRTASMICVELLSSPDKATAAQRVSARVGIGQEQALLAVEKTLAALAEPAPRKEPLGEFHYHRAEDGDGYELVVAGLPRVAIGGDGRSIRLLSAGEQRAAQVYEFVRAIAPKILFLRGSAVLHGSACIFSGKLLAICGESGAGKTTTIRSFVNAGARPIAEDLLVLTTASDARTSIYVNGERAVHDWARAAADRLVSEPKHRLPTHDLEEALSGDSVPIDCIWAIAAGRRTSGDTIVRRRFGRTEAMLATMASLFLGAASRDGWRRFLNVTAEIATSVPVDDASLPMGFDRLNAAIRAYTENSAS